MIRLFAILLVAGAMVSLMEWSIWPFLFTFGGVYIVAGIFGKRKRKGQDGRK